MLRQGNRFKASEGDKVSDIDDILDGIREQVDAALEPGQSNIQRLLQLALTFRELDIQMTSGATYPKAWSAPRVEVCRMCNGAGRLDWDMECPECYLGGGPVRGGTDPAQFIPRDQRR